METWLLYETHSMWWKENFGGQVTSEPTDTNSNDIYRLHIRCKKSHKNVQVSNFPLLKITAKGPS